MLANRLCTAFKTSFLSTPDLDDLGSTILRRAIGFHVETYYTATKKLLILIFVNYANEVA